MSNHYKQIALLLSYGLISLGGCAATNHPMTKMIRVQRDMMQEFAEVLHGVEDISDLEPATLEIKNLTEQMQHRMAQVTRRMGKDTIPTSQAEAKRLQSAMQREMKRLQPILEKIQKELERLSKQDWSGPLLEAAEKYKFESKIKS